jgi:hypothetical protein
MKVLQTYTDLLLSLLVPSDLLTNTRDRYLALDTEYRTSHLRYGTDATYELVILRNGVQL